MRDWQRGLLAELREIRRSLDIIANQLDALRHEQATRAAAQETRDLKAKHGA